MIAVVPRLEDHFNFKQPPATSVNLTQVALYTSLTLHEAEHANKVRLYADLAEANRRASSGRTATELGDRRA
jgi:hypothetical protein